MNKSNVAPILIGIAAIVAIGGLAGTRVLTLQNQVASLSIENERLSKGIGDNTMKVYTAKKDLKQGDEIVYSGAEANVEQSQITSSLPESAYLQDGTSGYAQVDIAKDMPVMANEVGDTNPLTAVDDAVAEVEAQYSAAPEIPYTITGDFVDASTGDTIADSITMTLDSGIDEKDFAEYAIGIKGFELSSIVTGKQEISTFGVSEQKDKDGGTQTLYYYTLADGLTRKQITANLHVIFNYVPTEETEKARKEETVKKMMEEQAADQGSSETADAGATEVIVEEKVEGGGE